MSNILRSFFILTILLGSTAIASDIEKEQRWADQIVDYLIDGDAEWLTVGKHNVLAIYTESSKPSKNTAIIIHGTGVHPNWEDVIYPLRTGLPQQGWNTLSIQMPILSDEASYEDYAKIFHQIAPRIDAAIIHVKQKGSKNIALIAHSLGTTMCAHYLVSTNNNAVQSFVAVGMPGKSNFSQMNNISHLSKINLPVLDLFGGNDFKSILNSAALRKKASKHNKKYIQIMIPEANHFFANKNEVLIQTVSNWLNNPSKS